MATESIPNSDALRNRARLAVLGARLALIELIEALDEDDPLLAVLESADGSLEDLTLYLGPVALTLHPGRTPLIANA